MKKTSAILAALSMGVATAVAGPSPAPSYSSGKEAAPPPPSVDPCAGPISYNNIELLYANTDFGGFGNNSLDGAILRAEYSPMQNLYIAGGVEYTDSDIVVVAPGLLTEDHFGIEDYWKFNIGIGAYFPLTENIHIAADAGYLRESFDGDVRNFAVVNGAPGSWVSRGFSNNGWYARPHLRGKWGCFTVKLGALYENLDQGTSEFSGGDWAYFVQLYYQLHSNWDVTAGYLDGENNLEQWTVGARYRF